MKQSNMHISTTWNTVNVANEPTEITTIKLSGQIHYDVVDSGYSKYTTSFSSEPAKATQLLFIE